MHTCGATRALHPSPFAPALGGFGASRPLILSSCLLADKTFRTTTTTSRATETVNFYPPKPPNAASSREPAGIQYPVIGNRKGVSAAQSDYRGKSNLARPGKRISVSPGLALSLSLSQSLPLGCSLLSQSLLGRRLDLEQPINWLRYNSNYSEVSKSGRSNPSARRSFQRNSTCPPSPSPSCPSNLLASSQTDSGA